MPRRCLTARVREMMTALDTLILPKANPSTATYDQLAEEMMELHLSLRGKHRDSPAMELLEIAGIALTMLAERPDEEKAGAITAWLGRHAL